MVCIICYWNSEQHFLTVNTVALDKEQRQDFCFVDLYICGQLAELWHTSQHVY